MAGGYQIIGSGTGLAVLGRSLGSGYYYVMMDGRMEDTPRDKEI